MPSFTLTGAHVLLYLNGHPVGFATSFSYSIDYGKRAIRGIDSPFPQEIAPSQQIVRGTINCVQLKSDSLEKRGIVGNMVGRDSGGHLLTDMLVENYITLALIDRQTNTIVLQLDKASILSQRWSAAPRGMVTGSFDFEGFTLLPVE